MSTTERETLPRDETEATEVESKVLKQCEFYFSDSNLPKDKFLRKTVKEGKGWVDLKVLATFNRLKELLPGHETSDARAEALGKILRKSENLLVVSKDNFVKRAVPLDPEAKATSLARSVAVEGLPTDKSVANINSVTEFFTGQGATVRYVKLLTQYKKGQTSRDRELNGVAFVELADVKEAEAYVAKEQKWSGQETPLKLTKLSEYLEARKKEKEESGEGQKKKRKGEETDAGAMKDPKGLQVVNNDRLIRISELGGEGEGEGEENEISRELLKGFITEQGEGEVAFVNFERGDKTAMIRLANESPKGAKEVVQKLIDSKAPLAGKVRKIEALEGEEEQKELQSIVSDKQARRKQKGKQRGKSGQASKKRQKTA